MIDHNTKGFIFDMDGVIIDSEPLHFEVDKRTTEHFGLDVTYEQLERYVGMTNPEMWASLRDEYGLAASVEEIISYQMALKIEGLQAMSNDPIDGIRELLGELRHAGIRVALASSSPTVFIREVLSKFSITHMFSCIVSGEEVECGKPAPDVFLQAAKLLEVSPEQCIVLEDSRNGVLAAKSAGMRCIGYLNPNSGNQDLSMANWTVRSIKEIQVHPGH